VQGIDATLVSVEVDKAGYGMPSFTVVGLAEGAVKESKERVRSALRYLDYHIFANPITINLAPADLKKDGSHFDLPAAVALVMAISNDTVPEDTILLGELSLDGALRGVSGVLCIASWAAQAGIRRIILPMDNAEEASLVEGPEIYPFDNLSSVLAFLKGHIEPKPYKNKRISVDADRKYGDFVDVKGQYVARRAAEIAAAGMHNILMMGSPGSGKTMIARRIVSVLPPMSIQEALLTTKVHSVAGLLKNRGALVRERPFVAPHHTASDVAIVGGGTKAMPGHVSIATNGILFLDEMLEFNRTVLEVLRQPLEDGNVTIARAGRTVTYPADFMLVAACNPCPCGYNGDPKKACICSPAAVERYKARLSGPLLDRIDLHVHVLGVDYAELKDMREGESSASIRERVMKAHRIQTERFQGTGITFNAQMDERMLKTWVTPDKAADKILADAMNKFALSARSYSKILKTSRTIADLAGMEDVKVEHVAEALQYRIF
jgi:magnesium chelatase family protein